MVYITLEILLMLLKTIDRFKIKIFKKRFSIQNIVLLVFAVMLFLLCALRRIDIGKDTLMYKVIFDSASRYPSLREYLKSYTYFEYSYYILNYFFAKYLNFQLFLATIGAISIFPAIYVIYKYSENKILSLIIYIGFPFYTFSMQALRQAPALGILMLAYVAIREEKFNKYLFFCILAFTFHTSSLLFFPAYFIKKIPYKKWVAYLVPIIMLIVYALRTPLQNIALNFARFSYSSINAGGVRMYIIMFLTVVLGLYYRNIFRRQSCDEDWKELFYFQVIAAMIWPIASYNPALARMYYYYQFFLILFVPKLVSNIKEKRISYSIMIGYVFISLFYLVNYLLPEYYCLNPYFFFWQ